MTIKYPNRFAEARPAGYDGLFDWDFLRGCFPRGIMPMDFDGVVELGGQFLVFETKQPGKQPEEGQILCFKALLEISNFTIFMLYGKTPKTITRLIVYHLKKREDINPATKDDVISETIKWAEGIEPKWQAKISVPKIALKSSNRSKKEITHTLNATDVDRELKKIERQAREDLAREKKDIHMKCGNSQILELTEKIRWCEQCNIVFDCK